MKLLLTILSISIFSFAAQANFLNDVKVGENQTRCGWITNPTPANYWISDADGFWTMSIQGGYQAPGLDKLDYPVSDSEYVENGKTFCGCITGNFLTMTTTDTSGEEFVENVEQIVLKITGSKAKTLKACGDDPALN